MIEFQSYQPETWFDDGLILTANLDTKKPNSRAEKRSQPWDVSIPRALLNAGVFAASTVFFGSITAAANGLDAIPIGESPGVVLLEPPGQAALSPLRAINRGFNELFDSMRSGQKVFATEDMRALAKKAAEFRDEKVDVDSWARQVVDDVKDADD